MALVVENLPANVGNVRAVSSIPGSERFPGGGHGNPLQYRCLENPMGRGALAGYSPWGLKESNMTEVTEHTHTHTHTHTPGDTHTWTQLTLITRGFHICEFTYMQILILE